MHVMRVISIAVVDDVAACLWLNEMLKCLLKNPKSFSPVALARKVDDTDENFVSEPSSLIKKLSEMKVIGWIGRNIIASMIFMDI